ncbi:MAG: hypothetical protein MUE40_16065 [Anaerolineae bacterium]|jgi:hypothetical protein|nr:hypothetical protein [Anaerolineae bacterium]
MAQFVSRDGVWDVISGGRSETPSLTVTGLQPGMLLKLTCQFTTRTEGGFYASLGTADDDDVVGLSPAATLVQGSTWHTCTLVCLFQVLPGTDGAAEFECLFNKGDQDGHGTLMNFLLLVETLS